MTCEQCANSGECALLKYSIHVRRGACALMYSDINYSNKIKTSSGSLIIPEDNNIWRERLTGFLIQHLH